MLLRMRWPEGGTHDAPSRLPLPTYRVISFDKPTMTVIVDVPDEAAPDEIDAEDTPLRPRIGGRPVLIGMRPAQRLAWIAKLAKTYPGVRDLPAADDVR